MQADLLLTNIGQLATPPGAGPRPGHAMSELRILADAAIAITDGKISWVGQRGSYAGSARETLDLAGRAVVPSLVDPHTHAVWAGDRLADFEARTAGIPYETILANGGGIRSSIRHTSAATTAELVELAEPRIEALTRSGAATIEVKSGYGFSMAGELESLAAIAQLQQRCSARILATLLVHIPPQNADERQSYLNMVTTELIPEVARRSLAGAVDIFIEREAFSVSDARQVFVAARANGLAIKAHVDQFHAIGGLELSIEFGALSVDHLEASGAQQVTALAQSRTVAVILPGVTLHLGLPAAPGRALIDAGALVAVGTDLNPGSSPLFSTQLAMALAVRLNGLTPAEALTAATVNAAAALGLMDCGAIMPGARADLLVLQSHDWRDITYTLGGAPVARHFIAGIEVLL